MNKEQDNLKERLLGNIRSGELNMRPRFYFTLQVAALVLVALVVLVISVFIFNFILFSIRLNHQDVFLNFGPRGWSAFVQFFPWTLFIVDVGLVFLLEWLLRQFRFGYRVPALYLLAGLLFVTVLTGALIDRGTPLNDRLWVHRHELPPPFGDVYGGARHHEIDDMLIIFGQPPGPPDDATNTQREAPMK